jgi:hypothetical protein
MPNILVTCVSDCSGTPQLCWDVQGHEEYSGKRDPIPMRAGISALAVGRGARPKMSEKKLAA